jgi:alcohol dehydrogenase (cytochrome c)
VALRGRTGELVWYFQFTPSDDHDWDSNQIPVLAALKINQKSREVVLWANRNGFYYVLDRETGSYITGTAFAQQTWASGLDPQGRPMAVRGTVRSQEGTLMFPGNIGATNWWWSPTYDRGLDLLFVPVLEQGMVYFNSVSPPRASGRSFYTSVRALRPRTGELVWEYPA